MIYSPNSAIDAQLLTHSRDLVRKALALLRNSDHLVSAQRLREELSRENSCSDGQPYGHKRLTVTLTAN
ncbi:hypothetical protein [Bradyrhizobium sp. Cp5.3]|uniref:hypothetical protein n=1 Tax=Bradyrhizobium sp. Cp5.3 TaxID=443598 RepID=UPI0003FEF6A6|nr:hypothetical protein [Bradyrhizobium sp. Cp5.3]